MNIVAKVGQIVLQSSEMLLSKPQHLGEFPIGLYLKVKDSTKSVGRFSVLVRRIFFLYHLKAYLYSFILIHSFKFLGAPFMA